MASLYELTADFLALQAMLEDPEADEQMLHDTMEAVEGEIEYKANGYAMIIRNMEGQITAIKTELERLSNRKNLLESSVKRLKDNLQGSMELTGKTKFKTDLFSFGIQKNGGALPVIVDVPVEDLPDECVIVEEKPDKKALTELLQDPENKDYYSKFAHFGDRGVHLSIK